MLIDVEVAFASVHQQALIALQVEQGTTAAQAVELSQIAARFPQDDLSQCPIGIFAKLLPSPDTYALAPGDRVELYRPLLADPKEVRRIRAAKAALLRKAT